MIHSVKSCHPHCIVRAKASPQYMLSFRNIIDPHKIVCNHVCVYVCLHVHYARALDMGKGQRIYEHNSLSLIYPRCFSDKLFGLRAVAIEDQFYRKPFYAILPAVTGVMVDFV